ncbi:MAG: hypothetical protein L0229_29730 [Blastocatellia bacterium]|nr:hypothetical protein [Blastocatellia bacterium]
MELYHDSFDLQTQCEEVFTTDLAELAELQSLMAAPDEDFEGYPDWSEEIEADRWAGAVPVETSHGPVLIKKACEHTRCPLTLCLRSDLRLEGFDI